MPSARTTLRAAAGLAGLTLLAACGTSGSTSDAVTKPVSATAPAVQIPTQDVVSAVKTDPALHDQLPAKAKSSGTLLLGTTLTPGTAGLPHGGTDSSGATVGLDVDLRNAVAKVLGITWKVQNGTFPTIIPGVQNGKYDVGQDNFGVTAAREQVVDFATYLKDGQSFLGGKSAKVAKVTTLTDVCGAQIGTGSGSTFQQILTAGAQKCAAAGKKAYHVQYFTDNAPIWLGLQNGKLDLYFGPTLSLLYDAKNIPGTTYLGQVSSTDVGFVTAKGSPVAKAVVGAVNELIKDGDYQRILTKWGVASSGIPASALNPTPAL